MLQPIEKKLITIPGISPLQFDDEKMLRSLFPKKSPEYIQSFLYLLRTSHDENGNKGYKFIGKNIAAIIGYRKKNIYITPIVDTSKGEHLQKLCEIISQKTGCRVLLKKFSKEKHPKIHIDKNAPLSETELEDGAYPESVIVLPKLFVTPEGKVNRKAKRFYRKVKRFKKLPMHVDMEIINDLSAITQEKIEDFLIKDHKKYISYHPIITYLYLHGKDDHYSVTIFLYKGTVQAVYIVEHFSSTEAGLYCGVTAKNQPGITEWMDHHIFQKMFFEGIQTVYLGGSENAGINYFVSKLLPEKPNYFAETVEYKLTKK
jgi:hypothetical protein